MTEDLLVQLEQYIKAHGATSGGSWSSGEPMITVRVSALEMMLSEVRRLWAREKELLRVNNMELEKRRAAESRAELLRESKDYWLERAADAQAEMTATNAAMKPFEILAEVTRELRQIIEAKQKETVQ
jgi:hypothetical protein